MGLNIFEITFLIPIILIGFFCFLTDIKEKKVYNKAILFGFLYGLVFFLYFLIIALNKDYLIAAAINFVIAALMSYFLWFYNYWSAGDAKLFSLFCFLLPLDFYTNSNYPLFPGFSIMVNLVVPVAFLFLVSSILGIFGKKGQKIEFKSLVDLASNFIKVLFVYILLPLLVQKIFTYFDIYFLRSSFFYIILIFLIIFSYKTMMSFLKKNIIINYIVIFCSIGYSFFLILTDRAFIVEQVFYRAFIFLGFLFFFRFIVNNYVNKIDVEKVKVSELKEGMVVSENDRAKYRRAFDGNSEKLTANDIDKIKRYCGEENYLNVCGKFSFAPYIFIAVIITIVLRGSLLSLII